MPSRNYLRVRGEYKSPPLISNGNVELPPRARRIHTPISMLSRQIGTTSACAENTQWKTFHGATLWNYLRVRGEYTVLISTTTPTVELPPRARRIRGSVANFHAVVGTTSACAENTDGFDCGAVGKGNYLRVRGEYCLAPEYMGIRVELPPRARRIPPWVAPTRMLAGTTSACAENTLMMF